MKLKKVLAVSLTVSMMASMAACGSSSDTSSTNSSNDSAKDSASGTESAAGSSAGSSADGVISYADLKLGEDCTDLAAEISVANHRTDLQQDDYTGKKWDDYLADFNAMYPNIKVNVETVTDYAETSLLRLQSGDYWGDIMMIPAVDNGELSTYFYDYGSLDTMEPLVRFANSKMYDGEVYGIASTGNAQGIVYNKKVFEEAGITALPKTPDEFMTDLQMIKDNTDAIPLYTNYAAGWTMGAWDAYIGGSATGDSTYLNQKLAHTKDPFSDPGDGTHAYNVYKILYDAVAGGLTEDDYTTTDWEGCKGMINNGEIGCMVLGSWAYTQMRDAGDNGADIGYMPFPITVDGKQYASSGADYAWGINKDADDTNLQASIIFVKWMTEKSGFSYNEGGMPIALDDDNWPEVYSAFDGIDYVSDDSALEGEEDLLTDLNSDSELNINNSGDSKIQELIEHAANGDESFDDIMNDWNQKWTDAQDAEGVEVNE
ncbi:extracellular solute-binding protein [Roseburia sp. BX0805]|uniref:Extracellular solute-binding protein n=1 Tax=Roseburia yibonii TaxID=2763063 RepID=A0ABR7IBP3_9FIRM|nr:extracellular solute-binding protein [Roseburia yibonii]MBC5754337.1 extracellular solute-binding protein [Roseburia yibonii]